MQRSRHVSSELPLTPSPHLIVNQGCQRPLILNTVCVVSRHPDADDTNVRTLLVELADWCSAERGRQQQIADLFGVKRAAVNNCLAGRAVPSLRIGLGIQAFLAQRRRRR